MTGPRIGALAALAVVASLTAACGGDSNVSDRSERSARTIEMCREHGGVAAFDDDAVICADGTFLELSDLAESLPIGATSY